MGGRGGGAAARTWPRPRQSSGQPVGVPQSYPSKPGSQRQRPSQQWPLPAQLALPAGPVGQRSAAVPRPGPASADCGTMSEASRSRRTYLARQTDTSFEQRFRVQPPTK